MFRKLRIEETLKPVNAIYEKSTGNIILKATAFPLSLQTREGYKKITTSTQYFTESSSQFNEAKMNKMHLDWEIRHELSLLADCMIIYVEKSIYRNNK